MSEILIEIGGAKNLGPCPQCGMLAKCIWGFAYDENVPFGAYYVRWTPGHLRTFGADVSLVLGLWGEGAGAADRYVINAIYRIGEMGRGFMLIDSPKDADDFSSLAAKVLTRTEVLGTPLADQSFRCIDAVFEQDSRLAEFELGAHGHDS